MTAGRTGIRGSHSTRGTSDTFAADLRIFRKRVLAERGARLAAGDVPALVMGEHCKYCPAFTHCPAQGALIRRMALEPEGVANDLRALLTPETAAKAYERVKLVREAMKKVEAALHRLRARDAHCPGRRHRLR